MLAAECGGEAGVSSSSVRVSAVAAAAAPRCAQLGCPKLTEGWLLPAGPSAQRGDTDLLRDTADPPHSLEIFLVFLTNIFGVVSLKYFMLT